MNSLDLDPEWGAIDLLEEVEASFGIKIEDTVAEQIETVGDL
jgi:acyl carrier protein